MFPHIPGGQSGQKEPRLLPFRLGLRKIKSFLAILIGFCIWQTLRLFLPGLEMHPIFVYIYGVLELRETSDKTRDFGGMRIRATFTAILIGLPLMLLHDRLSPILEGSWTCTALEITILSVGALIVLGVAECVRCRAYCGLAAAIYIILLITHFESSSYLYSIMRAFQTMIGVFSAWLINVKILPHPPKPGTLSWRLEEWLGNHSKDSSNGKV